MGDDMTGRVALVTGGGSGIGRAAALAFAHRGASVAVADIDSGAALETTALIDEHPDSSSLALAVDVTDGAAVKQMVARIVDRFGRLDFAHNNAGVTGVYAPLTDYDDAEWARVIAVNLTSVYLCMKHEIPAMLAAGGGAIVNTSSGAGLVGFAGLPAYVASKHGVVGLTKSVAIEYARSNVRVNAVCPGSTRTPMLETFMGADPSMEKMMAAGAPQRRLGSAEEVAEAVVWLCSDAASFITGVALPVDGGSVAQ